MQKRLVIFDLDGTIVHPWWQGLAMVREEILARMRRELKQKLSLKEIILQVCDLRTYIFQPLEIIIPRLAARYQLAILTNSSRRRALRVLGEKSRYFVEIVGKENVRNRKPSPEGIEIILRRTDCKSQNTLLVGDTAVDLVAGRRAAIKTGLVAWGFESTKKNEYLRPDYIFRNPYDLLRITI